jgi:ketosteroid isomerase-like protein
VVRRDLNLPAIPPEPAVTDTDQPIRQLLAGYQAAVLAKDVDAFVALYADDVLVYELWGTWTQDIASWRAMARGWFESLGDQSWWSRPTT